MYEFRIYLKRPETRKRFHSLYFSETIISGGNLIDYIRIISFVKHWYS